LYIILLVKLWSTLCGFIYKSHNSTSTSAQFAFTISAIFSMNCSLYCFQPKLEASNQQKNSIVQEQLVIQQKQQPKITNIELWRDAFLICFSIYCSEQHWKSPLMTVFFETGNYYGIWKGKEWYKENIAIKILFYWMFEGSSWSVNI
jgi:hypothetical protein